MRVALCYDLLRFFPRCYDLFFLDSKLIATLVVVVISISCRSEVVALDSVDPVSDLWHVTFARPVGRASMPASPFCVEMQSTKHRFTPTQSSLTPQAATVLEQDHF